MREPIIRPLPTEEKFRELVDTIIPPEAGYNDVQVRAFVDVVLAVANPEDNYSWGMANAAVRHAFVKTQAFETAFKRFAGFPESQAYRSDRMVIRADKEM